MIKMKRLIVVLLAVILTMTLISCGDEKNDDNPAQSSTTVTTKNDEPTGESSTVRNTEDDPAMTDPGFETLNTTASGTTAGNETETSGQATTADTGTTKAEGGTTEPSDGSSTSTTEKYTKPY